MQKSYRQAQTGLREAIARETYDLQGRSRSVKHHEALLSDAIYHVCGSNRSPRTVCASSRAISDANQHCHSETTRKAQCPSRIQWFCLGFLSALVYVGIIEHYSASGQ